MSQLNMRVSMSFFSDEQVDAKMDTLSNNFTATDYMLKVLLSQTGRLVDGFLVHTPLPLDYLWRLCTSCMKSGVVKMITLSRNCICTTKFSKKNSIRSFSKVRKTNVSCVTVLKIDEYRLPLSG